MKLTSWLFLKLYCIGQCSTCCSQTLKASLSRKSGGWGGKGGHHSSGSMVLGLISKTFQNFILQLENLFDSVMRLLRGRVVVGCFSGIRVLRLGMSSNLEVGMTFAPRYKEGSGRG